MKKVLVADGEAPLRRSLGLSLTAQAYRVLHADTGERALQVTATERPDLLIVELRLRGITGLQVIEAVRGWSSVPIIAVTSRNDERPKVIALDAGADDCVTKPFGMAELLARVRAVLRREQSEGVDTPEVMSASIRLDFVGRRAFVGEQHNGELHLTAIEWQIVDYLVRNQGRLITHRMLISEVWGPTYSPTPNLLRVHVANVRRKLEEFPAQPRHFVTVNGIGYRFENNAAPPAPIAPSPTPGHLGSLGSSHGRQLLVRATVHPVVTDRPAQLGVCVRRRRR